MVIRTTYLTEGATNRPMKMRRPITMKWSGGISKMCFKKNVFSSVTCQKITSWMTAANLIAVDLGSSQRMADQLSGVNCSMARLILPVVVDMSLILAHLYSRISRIWQIFRPIQMPRPLQMITSRMRASHQHSMKLGSRCAKVISVISHITEMAHRMPMWRMRMALKAQPKKWPQAKTSKWPLTRSQLMSEQLTPYSWKLWNCWLHIGQFIMMKDLPFPYRYGSSSTLDQSSRICSW